MKIFLFLFFCFCFAFPQKSATAANDDFSARQEVESLLEQSGIDVDIPDRKQGAARDELSKKGPEIVPILADLFSASASDAYRATLINLLFSIQGPKAQAIDLVERELAKDVSQWHGRRWVFIAVGEAATVAPLKAAGFAARVLDLNDEQLSAQSLVIIGRHGDGSHIARVQKFLADRFKNQEGSQEKDGLAISAQLAIDRITQRMTAGVKATASPDVLSPQPIPAKEAASLAPVPASLPIVPSPTFQPRWAWILGCGMIIGLLLLVVARRKR